jgi:hypothetical protein
MVFALHGAWSGAVSKRTRSRQPGCALQAQVNGELHEYCVLLHRQHTHVHIYRACDHASTAGTVILSLQQVTSTAAVHTSLAQSAPVALQRQRAFSAAPTASRNLHPAAHSSNPGLCWPCLRGLLQCAAGTVGTYPVWSGGEACSRCNDKLTTTGLAAATWQWLQMMNAAVALCWRHSH